MKRTMKTVKDDLAHVFWIGGSGCAGKTTISDRIAKEYGFRVYHCDEHWDRHISKAVPEKQPAMCRARELELERILLLPPQEFAKTAFEFYKEDFEMIIDDLYSLPRKELLVEGVSVAPEFVCEISDKNRVVFMIAFEAFQREHYLNRESTRDWFQYFAEPKNVFENMMRSGGLVAKSVYDSATELGLNVIVTDKDSTLPKTMEMVKECFGL